MNIINGLMAYAKAKDAATANHISGWLGTAVAVSAGFVISQGYVQQLQEFVCRANPDDIGLVVAVIGAGASFLNSGTTKALTPSQIVAKDDVEETKKLNNSELERISQPYPKPKKR